MAKRFFILFDSRACGDAGTDDAAVLVACDGGDKEAQTYKGDFGDMAAYSYEVTKKNELINERWEWDYREK